MLSSCSSFLVKETTNSVEKTSIIIFGIKEKQLYCENYFYHLFIIVKGMTTPLSFLPAICYSPFTSDVYLVDNISIRLNFQQVYSIGER